MDKQISRSIGLLMMDVVLVSMLIYGGWVKYISLSWIWFVIMAIIIFSITGKIYEVKRSKKSIIEKCILFLGSSINLVGLFYTEHYITFSLYLICTIFVMLFNKLRKD